MSREIDKAFLKVYDGNNLGKASPEAVRIAKYYFTMGYEAAQQCVQADGYQPTELKEDDDSCQCLMCGDVHRRR